MNSRGLRITRWCALGLIALPEPITTVIGTLILIGTGVFSKKLRDRQSKLKKEV